MACPVVHQAAHSLSPQAAPRHHPGTGTRRGPGAEGSESDARGQVWALLPRVTHPPQACLFICKVEEGCRSTSPIAGVRELNDYKTLQKEKIKAFPLWLRGLRSWSCVREDAGSVPGLSQRVKERPTSCSVGLSGSTNSIPRECPYAPGAAAKRKPLQFFSE